MHPLDQYERVARPDCMVRPMEKADMTQVMAIENQSYSHPWSAGVFADCDRPPYERWLLEQEGEGVAGYAIILPQVDELHLLNLCIAPALRNRGLARLLLRHVITRAEAVGGDRVVLEVRQSNLAAQSLYRSEGFVEVGHRKGYYPGQDAREDARVMTLELKKPRDPHSAC